MNYTAYRQNTHKKFPIWLKIIGYIFLAIFVCFMCFVFYLNVILEFHEVKGSSMYPTLNGNSIDEDYVYSFATQNVERGDIVIYNTKGVNSTEDKLVIKRLIALGGDHVKVRETDELENANLIFEVCIRIGGEGEWQVVNDCYVSSRTTNYALYQKIYNKNLENKIIETDENGEQYLVVPEGYFFAIGDNRVTSEDCASYGPVENSHLQGKVVFVIYKNQSPIFQALGQLFGGKKWL